MTEFNILDFLRTGEFKEFPYGTDIKKVIDAFGETTWTIPISRKDKRFAVLKYDQTEFYFSSDNDQKLEGIQITYSQPGDKLKFQSNYQDLREALNYSATKTFLSNNNISFAETVSKADNKTKLIVTANQVTFFFQDDERLEKFGRFVNSQSVADPILQSMLFRENTYGKISLIGDTIVWAKGETTHAEISLEEIKVIGEFANANGPHLDDWFLTIITTEYWHEIPMDVIGIEQLLLDIGMKLNANLKLELVNSTEWKTRIMYPEKYLNRELYQEVEVSPSNVKQKIQKFLGLLPTNRQFSETTREIVELS